jgi:L-amino acid N-acyltransferase YncA
MQIRSATEADLPEILQIYNEVIANSTAIYSEQPVPLEDRVNWFRTRREQQYPVLVATDASGAIGIRHLAISARGLVIALLWNTRSTFEQTNGLAA